MALAACEGNRPKEAEKKIQTGAPGEGITTGRGEICSCVAVSRPRPSEKQRKVTA